MLPLDTYIKNRRNYAILRKGDDKVFAYPRAFIDKNIPCVGRLWNVPMFYRRTYRELSYDFKHAKIDLR
jgi:hypothetical protein